MKRVLVSIMVLSCLVLFSSAAFAASGSLEKVKLGLHGKPHPAKAAGCAGAAGVAAELGCDDAGNASGWNTNFTAQGEVVDLYIVAADVDPAEGMTGAAFGIAHNNPPAALYVAGFAWTACADQEFKLPDWPVSGRSITLTYLSCQGTAASPGDLEGDANVVLGWFYMYDYAGGPGSDDITVSLTERLDIAVPDAAVTDCDPAGSDLLNNPRYPQNLGSFHYGLGTGTGSAPCVEEPTPVENTTWGSLKNGFKGE